MPVCDIIYIYDLLIKFRRFTALTKGKYENTKCHMNPYIYIQTYISI